MKTYTNHIYSCNTQEVGLYGLNKKYEKKRGEKLVCQIGFAQGWNELNNSILNSNPKLGRIRTNPIYRWRAATISDAESVSQNQTLVIGIRI